MTLPASQDLLKIAQDVAPPQRHYFVLFQSHEVQVEHVPPGRFGTLTEIDALARWLGKNSDIRSVLVISSAAHLRRIRMCCRSLLNPSLEIAFLAAPLSSATPSASSAPDHESNLAQSTESPTEATKTDNLLELFKLSMYWLVLKMR
jgi:hypothetical protein